MHLHNFGWTFPFFCPRQHAWSLGPRVASDNLSGRCKSSVPPKCLSHPYTRRRPRSRSWPREGGAIRAGDCRCHCLSFSPWKGNVTFWQIEGWLLLLCCCPPRLPLRSSLFRVRGGILWIHIRRSNELLALGSKVACLDDASWFQHCDFHPLQILP